MSLSVMTLALPDTDAHSPKLLRKPKLTSALFCRSSVFPDSVFV